MHGRQGFERQTIPSPLLIIIFASIVIIVSDGYDTGEPQELVKQLSRIKRRARRLVWLNPLLGQDSYSPETRCIMAALPLLDVFAPAHNLESLAALEQHLRGI